MYRARDVSIDRASIHITLEDGTLAFTKDVAGRVTGAFFEGEGEILLAPPNQLERSSMALFTGAAILEERFFSGYFRFNDDTFTELKPALRPAEDSDVFVSEWNETAQNLASIDALRLLMSFSKQLPSTGARAPAEIPLHEEQMWHARLQGQRWDHLMPTLTPIALSKCGPGQEQNRRWRNLLRHVDIVFASGRREAWSRFAGKRIGQDGCDQHS